MIRTVASRVMQSLREYRAWEQAKRDTKSFGFWYVDIPRTSSSSIRTELAAHFGTNFGKRYLFDDKYAVKQSYPAHIPANRVRKKIGQELWDSTFTFTLVRNPWDRVFSIYWYARKAGDFPESFSFRECVLQYRSPRYLQRPSVHSVYPYYYSASEYLVDRQGELLVNFVGRYENRAADLAYIGNKIGHPTLGNLAIQQAAPHVHYSRHYDDEMIEIVRTVFWVDIERFGYEFEIKP